MARHDVLVLRVTAADVAKIQLLNTFKCGDHDRTFDWSWNFNRPPEACS